jgi:hypothetical protein
LVVLDEEAIDSLLPVSDGLLMERWTTKCKKAFRLFDGQDKMLHVSLESDDRNTYAAQHFEMQRRIQLSA